MIQHECQLFIQYKSLNIININDIKTFYYYDISIHNMSENLEETTFQNEIININGVNVNIINIDTIDSESIKKNINVTRKRNTENIHSDKKKQDSSVQ